MNEDYITTDTLLVAALMSSGIKFNSVNSDKPNKIEFIFTNDPLLQNAVTGHYMGALVIPSLTFGNNYKYLISLIANIKNGATDSRTSKSRSK